MSQQRMHHLSTVRARRTVGALALGCLAVGGAAGFYDRPRPPSAEPPARAVVRSADARAEIAAQPTDRKGALPVGKGMWLWKEHATEGGDVGRIVQRAVDTGLTHLYVRTGSSWMGFYAQPFLDRLLPAAHAAGIRVYGWDFPNLADWQVDAERALAAIRYTTPDGHRVDGFAADIETGSEGTRITPEAAFAYGTFLRQGVGNDYPLIACAPARASADASERRFPAP